MPVFVRLGLGPEVRRTTSSNDEIKDDEGSGTGSVAVKSSNDTRRRLAVAEACMSAVVNKG